MGIFFFFFLLITIPSYFLVPANLEREIELKLEELEKKYSRVAMARLCSFLTISEFGLTETELLELLMPTSGGSTTALKLEDGFYNFFTFYTVIRSMTKGEPILLFSTFLITRLGREWVSCTWEIQPRPFLRGKSHHNNNHVDYVRNVSTLLLNTKLAYYVLFLIYRAWKKFFLIAGKSHMVK